MRSCQLLLRRTLRQAIVLAVVAGTTAYTASAQTSSPDSPSGPRVNLDVPDVPTASVELDLGPGLVRHFFSTGDAVLAGFLDGLATSQDAEAKENLRFAAERITSARELGDIASEIVSEVHVRAWKDGDSSSEIGNLLVEHFDGQLTSENWEPVVRARDGGEMVRIYVHRQEESVNGVLVVASGHDGSVALNLVGDLSPQNVQRLVSTATKVGVQLGLDKEISGAVDKIKMEMANKHHR